MADFKTHIGTSTLVGIGYGAAGYLAGAPISTCLVAGGLCSVSGMLPDLDSDSGKPVREMMCFMAAVVPALMLPRFLQMGWGPEQIALAAAGLYLAIRFGVAELFKRYTVHRGMWHSLPATATVGLLAFLVVSGDSLEIRLFKTGAVVLGFLTHLVLDEFWSVNVRRGRLKIKRSFGTAIKLWTRRSVWANVSTYGKVIVLVAAVIGDPYLMDQLGAEQPELPHSPKEWFQRVVDRSAELFLGAAEDVSEELTPISAEEPAPEITDAPNAPNAPNAPEEPDAETARRPFYYPTIESPVRR